MRPAQKRFESAGAPASRQVNLRSCPTRVNFPSRGCPLLDAYTLSSRLLTALRTRAQRLLPTARIALPIQKTLQPAKMMPASARRVRSSTGSNLTSSAEMRM
jgi:hypothetical protein